MTPTQLNKAIRAGEFFWFPDPECHWRDLRVLKAKSVALPADPNARIDTATGRPLKRERIVKIFTERGWIKAETIRRTGSREQIHLFPEGVLTWAIN